MYVLEGISKNSMKKGRGGEGERGEERGGEGMEG